MIATRVPTQMPRKNSLRITGMLIASTMLLSACGTGIEDPTEAAQTFGEQLESEEFLALQDAQLATGSIQPQTFSNGLEALAQYPMNITLDSAEIHENQDDSEQTTATANYTVQWDLTPGVDSSASLDEHIWTYTTQATLVWDEETETWLPTLASETLVPGLTETGQVVVDIEPAQRAEILDAQQQPLATHRPVKRIGIDKTHILEVLQTGGVEPSDEQVAEAVTASATALAEALELDPEPLVSRTLAAGERAWVEFIVLRDDNETDIPHDEILEIQGALAMSDTMILGPTRTFARSILGSYGEPTAEQIEASDGEFSPGIPTGLTGLQRTYNTQLAGTDGLHISVDNGETPTSDLPETAPVDFERPVTHGQSITTTLDTNIQQLAEDMIDESEVPAGLVVLRPSDGHILAAADGPADTGWPLALTGSYPPGSTFKMVTALAMLRNGMTPDTMLQCPQTINIEGTEISNYDGYPTTHLGDITLADAIAQSCNTSFVGQWQDITAEQFSDAAIALGLVDQPITGFDGAVLGSIPTDVEGPQHAAGLFGQGLVTASPLGMATVAASIAAGETVTPTLIQDPSIDPTEHDQIPGNAPLTAQEATTLHQLMAGPVETGTATMLQEVPGAPVYAKTGTAQYVEDGEELAHTWIMATHGDLAVALFYTEGFAGGQTNGPVLREFLTELEQLNPST